VPLASGSGVAATEESEESILASLMPRIGVAVGADGCTLLPRALRSLRDDWTGAGANASPDMGDNADVRMGLGGAGCVTEACLGKWGVPIEPGSARIVSLLETLRRLVCTACPSCLRMCRAVLT
jgi:hypothetical protein